MLGILAFIFVFMIVVLAHEFGHYLSARKFGVKVEEFAIGLPPRLLAKKLKRLNFIINLIPIGGYVKIKGEDGQKDDSDDNLVNKKTWQKVTIVLSGVIFNLLSAYIFLTAFYAVGGTPYIYGMWDHNGVINDKRIVVEDIEKNSPAEKAGVKPGDIITSVNGKEVFFVYEVTNAIRNDEDNTVNITFQRGDETYSANIKTYKDTILVDGEEKEVDRAGVVLNDKGKIRSDWYKAPVIAFQEIFRILKMSTVAIGDFLRSLFLDLEVSKNVGGPVAIAKVVGVASEFGFGAIIQTIIVLNIALAVFNVLPFPALDGGHAVLFILEKVIGREISTKARNIINTLGFALLILLLIVVTWNDVLRLGIMR